MKRWTAVFLMLALLVALTPAVAETADNSLQAILDKGKLILGLDASFPPMGFTDPDTGEITGFDIDLAKEVAARLGVELVTQPIDWAAKEMELNAGNIDCIWNGMTIDEERLQNMNISRPYVKNKQVVVIRRENAELYTDTASLAGKTIAAEAGSAGEKVVKENADLSKGTLVPVLQQTDALLEVKAGTSDAAVLDYVMAKAMVGEGTDYADLQIVEGLELAVEEYGIGFRKNSTATAQVNAVIEELIADGTLQALADKYDVNLAD